MTTGPERPPSRSPTASRATLRKKPPPGISWTLSETTGPSRTGFNGREVGGLSGERAQSQPCRIRAASSRGCAGAGAGAGERRQQRVTEPEIQGKNGFRITLTWANSGLDVILQADSDGFPVDCSGRDGISTSAGDQVP
ncbi:MAG: Hypothetical protein C75L2_00040009 [Leptospirillum sp. Group II 'C75']|uniref:Uncharacterized protein n=1 Tax=Leptospirillum sp. Group II '5-way CG' TaxID=419541 RepID=B6AM48_9BACT|nr:MAG: Hypothetical protein CGL2_11277191a [Leptospirillum sp. Group II '5-way CG']EIJ76877.1 MAG: Hypothetical protein C75L2_00040009 [Leptospirillum sp. Group II 'C75']